MKVFHISKWSEIFEVKGEKIVKWFARTYKNPERDRRTGTEKKHAKRLNVLAMKEAKHYKGDNRKWISLTV